MVMDAISFGTAKINIKFDYNKSEKNANWN